MGVLAEMGVRVLDSTWKDWGFGLGAGGSGKQPRTGRLAGRLGVRASGQGWDVWRAFKDGTFELDMGALAGRWEWEFWIRHGRAGGSGWALAGLWLGVRAGCQERDVWQAFKDGTFELDMGALAGRWGAGRLNSAWRPEQVAGGQGAEGLSGRESSYSGRAASVSSKHL